MAQNLESRSETVTNPVNPSSESHAKAGPSAAYSPPKGVSKELTVALGSKQAKVTVHCDWLLTREHGVPTAEVFYTSYQLKNKDSAQRPVTFLFNGGPGAASAFLHMGTAGPQRIAFAPNGKTLPPPAQLIENKESWLAFSDLVFVDPVGTGFSRTVAESKLESFGVDQEDEKAGKSVKSVSDKRRGFFKVKKDIDTLCEFVEQWLSTHNRWQSPISIAGESYGGFRVGKLIKALPEKGIGLRGAIMVSPAIDFLGLVGADYDVLHWTNTLPTMALAARYHKKSKGKFASMSDSALRSAVQDFAEGPYASFLIKGARSAPTDQSRVIDHIAEITGLAKSIVQRHGGRVPITTFASELLRDEGKVLGLYDAAVTGENIFPDRENFPNPDPTLAGIMSCFTAGINTFLRSTMGLKTSREYTLLGEDIFHNWADDRMTGYWHRQLDCADDMRYGLGMNPHLKLFICHGWYDLVTTYHSSQQAVSMLRLSPTLAKQVVLTNYTGGHMFYSWDQSRKAVFTDAQRTVV